MCCVPDAAITIPSSALCTAGSLAPAGVNESYSVIKSPSAKFISILAAISGCKAK
jgi:hypothetical protein